MKNLILFLLLLTACSPVARPKAIPSLTPFPTFANRPVPSPSATASPAVTPTLTSMPVAKQTATTNPMYLPIITSTPVPPLVAHAWSQGEPLIIFDRDKGGMPRGFLWELPADLTLLPDGELYLLRRIDDQRYAIFTATLSRQAICYLLNSIDQAGFFDYEPSRYLAAYPGPGETPGAYHWMGGTDRGGTLISVDAWRANSVDIYNLSGAIRTEREHQPNGTPYPGFPIILPAIRGTYALLDEYQVSTGDPHLLKPERLGVWFSAVKEPAGTQNYIEWPLSSHALAAAGPGIPSWFPAMILTGEEATRVYDALGAPFGIRGTTVREGGKLYQVFSRPLLPNELELYQVLGQPLSESEWGGVSRPEVSLSCSPTDGWMQAP